MFQAPKTDPSRALFETKRGDPPTIAWLREVGDDAWQNLQVIHNYRSYGGIHEGIEPILRKGINGDGCGVGLLEEITNLCRSILVDLRTFDERIPDLSEPDKKYIRGRIEDAARRGFFDEDVSMELAAFIVQGGTQR